MFLIKNEPDLKFENRSEMLLKPIKDNYISHMTITDDNGKVRRLNTVTHFQKKLYSKLKRGFSPRIVIVGEQGIGKSFVALYLWYFHHKLYGKPLDFKQNSFYDTFEAIEAIEKKYHEALIIDEAGDILDAQEWYEKTHRAIKSMLNTQRFRQNIYIFISPFLSDIDRAVRKHFDFQLHVTAHGRFKAFKYYKRYAEPEQNKAVWPIFLDDISIKMSSLPKEIFDEYQAYSIEQKKNILSRRKDALGGSVSPSYINNLYKRIKKGEGAL